MDFLENINSQYDKYGKGLLTYTEMLQNMVKIIDAEMPRMIEYRKGKKGSWKFFSDIHYSKEEAADELERLSHNTLGFEFRAVPVR